MKTARSSAWILSVLLALVLSPLAARPDEETGAKTKMQKKPTAEAVKPAAEPTGSEGKAKAAPEHPAWRTIEGTLVQLFPDRHMMLIKTHVNEYQVFATPQSALTLDGQPATLEKLKPGDRVDTCEFSAKNVIHKLTVTSAAKARYQQLAAPEKKP
jgi:hypothetical protein